MKKSSALIPYFNEGDRAIEIVKEVLKCKEVDEVICIDDGSTDNTTNLLKKKYPALTIVQLTKNVGKTHAILEGLKRAKGEFVVLIDADLRQFSFKDVDNVLKALQKNPSVDMIILRRVNAPRFIKLQRGDILVSGERALRRNDLKKILEDKIQGYELEVAINLYMMEHKKKVYWMPSSALNTYKFRKTGLLKGLWNSAVAVKDVLKFAGITRYAQLMMFFCREKLV